jgi:hypothetical protein
MFTWIFYKKIQEVMGMQLNYSTMYHLEINEQTERINNILKDTFHMHIMDQHK